MRSAFTRQKVEGLHRDVVDCAVLLTNRLSEFADSASTVDFNACLGHYHLASVAKSTFGYDLDALQRFPESHRISTAFEFLLAELPRRSFHPDAAVREDYVSGREENVRWKQAADTVRAVVSDAIAARLKERREKTRVTVRGDLLDGMIDSYHESSLESGSDEYKTQVLTSAIGDNLVEMFFAGYNTSVVGMCTALYHIASDPKVMQKARDEVDSVLQGDLATDSTLSPSDFPYLRCLFQESLRTVPPAPLLARLVTEELDLGDVKIPRNTQVWIPACYVHSDPQSWGSSVDSFQPERFEKPPKPGAFLPFSYGPRDCIGKHFAELESVIALAMLVKSYDFTVDPNFKFAPTFTGFGLRVCNANTGLASLNLIPNKRVESSFLYDWTPARPPKNGTQESDTAMPAQPNFS